MELTDLQTIIYSSVTHSKVEKVKTIKVYFLS